MFESPLQRDCAISVCVRDLHKRCLPNAPASVWRASLLSNRGCGDAPTQLAAARVGVLGIVPLLQRLDRPLPLLTSGAPDLLERQWTLRNTLAWSHALLEVQEHPLSSPFGLRRRLDTQLRRGSL